MEQSFRIFLSLILMSSPVSADTEIFTLMQFPTQPFSEGIQINYLDIPNQIERDPDLSNLFKANPKQVTHQARQLIENKNFQHYESKLITAYQGITKAWALGIEKVPAVVFDDHYVVYGTTDIAFASKKLAEFKGEKER